MDSIDHGPSPLVAARASRSPVLTKCPAGGEPAEDGDPSSPSGYAYVWPNRDSQMQDAFWDPDPDAAAAYRKRINRDPCGDIVSLATFEAVESLYLSHVDVPVFILFGAHDALALSPEAAAAVQAARFVGSSDVRTFLIPHAGHDPTRERLGAAEFRKAMARWLAAHGL